MEESVSPPDRCRIRVSSVAKVVNDQPRFILATDELGARPIFDRQDEQDRDPAPVHLVHPVHARFLHL